MMNKSDYVGVRRYGVCDRILFALARASKACVGGGVNGERLKKASKATTEGAYLVLHLCFIFQGAISR